MECDVAAMIMPPLAFSEEEARRALAEAGGLATGRFWVLHPGSGGAAKNAPPAVMLAAARRAAGAGMDVVITAGEADGTLGRELAAGLREAGVNARLVENAPLAAVGALLSRAAGFFGNDTGIAHLAAAAGCRRVVTLFGPTDPAIWRAPGAVAVRAPDGRWDALDMNAALDAMRLP